MKHVGESAFSARFGWKLATAIAIASLWPGLSHAQTWTPLKNQLTFSGGTPLLLTDGTVMVQDSGGSNWWKLTPDNTGSYINGTWSQLASLPSGYAPLYFASAVLPDGRVIVEGGEYNRSAQDWTNKGAIYDPTTNVWTTVTPPSGWTSVGDAQSVVLPNGSFMLANALTEQQAILDPSALTWTAVGTGKADGNDEEGWTLLPDGTVLCVDANNTANLTNSERYFPAQGKWTTAGSTITLLADLTSSGGGSHELGPGVLRPDGTVFWVGATGTTAVYTPSATKSQPGTWAVGPSFPKSGNTFLDLADGPATLLVNGDVLVFASPGVFETGAKFFEFDGTGLNTLPNPSNAAADSSYVGRLLLLPNGQVLFVDGTKTGQVFTSAGTYNPAWAPTITKFPATVVHGHSYPIHGTLFNGLSQATAYGDDAQMATNYPLVRITNLNTGHVFYARTHGHTSMAVASTAVVGTQFDVPSGIETGPSNLEVVANGIPSAAVAITVN